MKKEHSYFIYIVIAVFWIASPAYSQCPEPVLYNQTFSEASKKPVWTNCIDNENTPESYELKISSPNDVYDYSIDWGDGSAPQTGSFWPANTTLTHTYGLGKYTVKLSETRNGCTKSVKGTMINDRKPGATATPPTLYTSGCVPHELTFINQSTNVSPYTKFTWTWGDGTKTEVGAENAGQPTSHEYLSAGCGNQVKLTATSLCASSYSSYGPYDMWAKDQARVKASAEAVCSGAVVTFTDQTIYNCNNKIPRLVQWDFRAAGGELTDWLPATPENKSIDFKIVGEMGDAFDIILKDSSYCGVATATVTVEVIQSPKAKFTVEQSTVCQGQQLKFENTTDGGADLYHWDYGDGSGWKKTNSSQPISYTFEKPGVFTTRMVAQVSGAPSCSDTLSTTVEVLASPKADFTFETKESCPPLLLDIENKSANAENYLWKFNGNEYSKDVTPEKKELTEPGVYEIDLEVQNKIGCAARAKKTVTVFPDIEVNPVVSLSCVGSPVSFSDTSNFLNNTGQHTLLREQFNKIYDNKGLLKDKTPDVSGVITNFESTEHNTNEFTALIRGFIIAPETGKYKFSIRGDDQAQLWLSTDDTEANKVKVAFVNGATKDWQKSPTQTSSSINLEKGKQYYVEVFHQKPATGLDFVSVGWEQPNGEKEFPIEGKHLVPYNEGMNIVSRTWDFGTGDVSHDAAPQYLYKEAGDYTGSLTVSNGNCSFSKPFTVKINESPVALFSLSQESGCSPFETSLTNLSTGGIKTVVDFGDGTRETFEEMPEELTHEFKNVTRTNKKFAVTLITENQFGCRDSVTKEVTVLPDKKVDFVFSPEMGTCSPVKVILRNTSEKADKYTWYFNDDSLSTNNKVFEEVFINKTGKIMQHPVRLKARFSNCEVETKKYITTYPEPDFKIISNTPECSRGELNLSVSGIVADAVWIFDNKDTLEGTEIVYPYNPDGGETRISVKAYSVFGCVSQLDTLFKLPKAPVADFTAPALEGCSPFTVLFENTSSNFSRAKWTSTDGFNYQGNKKEVLHRFENNSSVKKTFPVTLIVENEVGCIDTVVKTVTVNPLPYASFVSPDTIGCSPFKAFFKNKSENADSFIWNVGGESFGSRDLDYKFYNEREKDSVFTVSLTASSDKGCTSESTAQVVLAAKPVPSFTTNKEVFEPGEFLKLFNSTNNTFQVNWELSTGQKSDEENPSFEMNNSGTIIIQQTAYNDYCSETRSKEVHVINGPPRADFEGRKIGCGSVTVTFSNESFNAYKFIWYFGDGDSLEVNSRMDITHTFVNRSNQSKSYEVKLVSIGLGGIDSVSKSVVELKPIPYVAFTQSTDDIEAPGEVYFYNQSKHANKYYWDFGDGNFSESENTSNSYSTPGKYTVKLIAENDLGCRDTLTVGEAVNAREGGSLIMPNSFTPARAGSPGSNLGTGLNDVFGPGYHQGVTEYHLQIFDKWGVMLFESHDVNKGWNGYFKNELCKEGVYVYKVKAKFSDGNYKEFVGDVSLLYF